MTKHFLSLTLPAFLATIVVAQTPDRVQLRCGEIEGVQTSGGIRVFKGIPFAEPPTGELRWKGPRPIKPWDGVKQTKAFAPSPMQESVGALLLGVPLNLSEDCLYLNVWTPAQKAEEKLPVMVWFYGGALKYGSTATPLFDGSRLAEKGVVIVSVAYRLGALGFLAHPELTREGEKGNFGLRDQIAGLEWVRDHIATFGGDPGCVTIFGESAGAKSVSRLAASPRAKGLFQRVISQSGGAMDPPKPLATIEREGERYLQAIGAKDLAAARSLPASKVLKDGEFDVLVDGEVLPGDPFTQYEAGQFNDTPVLAGFNSNDGNVGLLLAPHIKPHNFAAKLRELSGDHADAVLAVYPHATLAESRRSMLDFFNDVGFVWHTWAWAKHQSARGKHPAYVYCFDYTSPKNPDGAGHAEEIAYVFRNLDKGWRRPSAADVQVSDVMSGYWVNFAKTGNPNGPGLPEWSAFVATEPRVMCFEAAATMKPQGNLKRLEVIDAFFAGQREIQARRASE